jgi:hypothetical protein
VPLDDDEAAEEAEGVEDDALIDADGAFEAIGFAGADIVALDAEIIEVIAEREQRKKNDSQRGFAAANTLPFFEADAKERQAVGGKKAGRGRPAVDSSGPISPELIPPEEHRARDDAAEIIAVLAERERRKRERRRAQPDRPAI